MFKEITKGKQQKMENCGGQWGRWRVSEITNGLFKPGCSVSGCTDTGLSPALVVQQSSLLPAHRAVAGVISEAVLSPRDPTLGVSHVCAAEDFPGGWCCAPATGAQPPSLEVIAPRTRHGLEPG